MNAASGLGVDFLHRPGAAWPLRRERPLPGDQPPVPPQDRVGCDDDRHLPQDPATEWLALRREAPTLIVGQPDAPPLQLLPEDAVLLHEVLDDLLLVAVDPSSEDHEQQPQGREVGCHRPILPCHIPAPVPGTGSAEYSDTTGVSRSDE